MKCIFSVCLLLAFNLVWSQSVPLNLAAIPEGLKTSADVIVHSENINLEIESLDNARVKVQKVFSVLNEKGKNALVFHEYSSKAVSLEEAEIKVYDRNGKEVEKHKKKEMATTAVGEGLIEDGYVTYYRVTPPSYPVTVEFYYEQKLRSTLGLPDYRFAHYGEAVVQSTYKARVPAELQLRYKARLCFLVPTISKDEKATTYQWSVSNLPATEYEEGGPSGRSRLPYVEIVSDQFSHYGHKGDFSSWKNFGSWISSLYDGLDVLPPERQSFFQRLVAEESNDREKARRIYQYLQQNFRYVSIQLGIGGLQPFSAVFTDQKKYGDCKALSNYMKAALKAVGVRSCVAIINAGYNEEPVDKDFPANNFNHVVLCIPGKDSVWLECTSSTTAFDRLGTFTENRNALLITEEGGVLVRTPQSDAAANTLKSHTTVFIDNNLSAQCETETEATGKLGELMTGLGKETRDDQKQALVFHLGYKQPDDFTFTVREEDNRHQARVKMSIRKLPEFSAGTKYFFNPRVQKIWPGHLPQTAARKFDYYFYYPYVKKDTTVLKFPEGFQVEALPQPKERRTPYSRYETKSWYDAKENAIYTATTLVLEKHKIPASAYAEVKSFFDEVSQDDAQKIVMKRTETGTAEKKPF
jgi:transglutaminase-like putative cysteine protease